MGLPSDTRDFWASKGSSFMAAASPSEPRVIDDKTSTTQEAVQRGLVTAIIAGSVVAVPTLVGCRVLPWAKANLNYTAQALIISGVKVSKVATVMASTSDEDLSKILDELQEHIVAHDVMLATILERPERPMSPSASKNK